MSDEISQDGLRRQLDRLYEQEREERAERRGLEQRAATTVAASLVAGGIVLNAVGRSDFTAASRDGVLVIAGGVLTLFGLLIISVALTGAHTNEDMSIRQALFQRRPWSDIELEPQPLTVGYRDHQREYVGRLSSANVRVVPLLRLSSLVLAVAVYVTLFGFGWHVLR